VRRISQASFFVIVALTLPYAAQAGDAERGRVLYESRCMGCHSVDTNRIGPRHRGVFGRAVGGVNGYNYSPALRDARMAWDQQNLDRWLADPQAAIPGQRMYYAVPDSRDRADLIEYLRHIN
jgi:cytochrome c